MDERNNDVASPSPNWTIDENGTLILTGFADCKLGEPGDPARPTPWTDRADEVRRVEVRGDFRLAGGFPRLFAELKHARSADLRKMSLPYVEGIDLSGLFFGCANLTEIDLSGWDVSGVDCMNNMFANCESLVEVKLCGWNPEMMNHITGCWYASHDEYDDYCYERGTAVRMFAGCPNLARVDLSGWTDKYMDEDAWEGMFDGCPIAPELVLDGWGERGAQIMRKRREQAGCIDAVACRLEDDGTLVIEPPKGSTCGFLHIAWQREAQGIGYSTMAPWDGLEHRIKGLRVEPGVLLDGTREDLDWLISCLPSGHRDGDAPAIDLRNLQQTIAPVDDPRRGWPAAWPDEEGSAQPAVKDEAGTWPAAWCIEEDGTLVISPPYGCERGLLAFNRWHDCDSFSYSDCALTPWWRQRRDITAVRVEPGVVARGYLTGLFFGMERLVTADLTGLDVSAVKNMDGLFERCRKLSTVCFGAWDTSQVTSMSAMFKGCLSLTELDVADWDVSHVTDMTHMFRNCPRLSKLDLSRWDMSQADREDMFRHCARLEFARDEA